MRTLALALVVCLGGASLAEGAGGDRRLERDGISVLVPSGWHLTLRLLNGVVDPVTVFTVSTFPVRAGRPPGGICSRALQRAWTRNGAYVQLAEEREGISRRRMLRRVPQRPKRFRLDARGAGGLCTPPDSGQIAFHEKRRAFYVYYGFGPRASRATRAAAARMLNGMKIAARS